VEESYLKDAINLALVKRVLVIKLRHHGDVLLTSPVFSALASKKPDIEIDALVYAETSPMLEDHPAISEIHRIDRKWKKQGITTQWREERKLMTALQNRHYDLIIHLTEHARGSRLVRRLRPRYSVAQAYPEKRGRTWRSTFTHTYELPDKPRHMVEVHLDALRRLGIYPAQQDRKLVLNAGPDAEQFADELLAEHGLEPGGYILVHPTSRWMFKGWSVDGFAKVINGLAGKGYKLILTSAPDQAELNTVSKIVSAVNGDGVIDIAGQTDLKQLAALIDRAACFIGLDSVPMHIAAAMDTPCVALFGPSNDQKWGPWMVNHRVISAAATCRPCELDGCGNGKVSDCLMSIPADQVIAAAETLLKS
jgi:heptosyltransferase-3